MRKVFFVFFMLMPLMAFAQYLGVGAQFAQKDRLQLSVNSYIPQFVLNDKSAPFIFGIGGGTDYISPASSTVSGLNIKPASFFVITNNYSPFTAAVKFDAGYNFGFGRGNGIVLSPNLYFDAYMCYVSAGYDYNTFNGRGQFYVRIGAGLTLGLLKSLVNR